MPSRVSKCASAVAVIMTIAVLALTVGAPGAIARLLYVVDGPTAQANVPTLPNGPARLSMAKVGATFITLRWVESGDSRWRATACT